jgi:hypothetical protein
MAERPSKVPERSSGIQEDDSGAGGSGPMKPNATLTKKIFSRLEIHFERS